MAERPLSARWVVPPNNEMQRTAHGQDGAPPLISVLGRLEEGGVKISRRGTDRDQGTSSVDLRAPTVRWDSTAGCLTISSRRVQDFSGVANHDYDVTLGLEEFSKLLDALGDAATEDSPRLAAALTPSLKALLRLTLACVGLVGASSAGSGPTK